LIGGLGVEDNFLRASLFKEGQEVDKIAFLHRVVRKADVNGDLFLRFYFKTADKVMIIGRKFRISSNRDVGSEIVEAQRAVVSVKGLVTVFSGSYSILVDEVRILSGINPDVFMDKFHDIDRVVGRLFDAGKKFEVIGAWVVLGKVALVDVLGGKMGGILSVIDFVLNMLSGFEGEEFYHVLMSTWLRVIDPLVSILQLEDKTGFVPRKTVLDVIDGVGMRGGKDERSILVDTLMALVNVGVEEHYVAHIIAGAYRLAREQLEIADVVKVSPFVSLVEVVGKKVVLY
jgi:hypothetical protein